MAEGEVVAMADRMAARASARGRHPSTPTTGVRPPKLGTRPSGSTTSTGRRDSTATKGPTASGASTMPAQKSTAASATKTGATRPARNGCFGWGLHRPLLF